MRKYGLRISETGIEFSTREEREKAILTFTRGSTIRISTFCGIIYSESKDAFGTYERETNEIPVKCGECWEVFLIKTCPKREYPNLSYSKTWTTSDGYICDACYAKKIRAKEIADTKKILEITSE